MEAGPLDQEAAGPLIHEDYADYDALGLAELVRRNEVAPSELLEVAIDRLERMNPLINAVSQKLYDRARAAIRAGLPHGPFRGVPFLLKDLHLQMDGTPTTNGSRFFAAAATRDSELTARFKRAGFVIFGKTNTSELGMMPTTEPRAYGPTRNPWHRDFSPGGSSGGSAAAVASGIVPCAHASDGGGSIRIPASCCGLFGLKPSRGRTPCGPEVGEALGGLSIHHVVSRSVRDSAAVLDAVSGTDPGAPYAAPGRSGAYLGEVARPPGRLRIAVSYTSDPEIHVDSACKVALDHAAAACDALGHIITPVDAEKLPAAGVARIFTTIAAAHVARAVARSSLGSQPGSENRDLEPATRGLVELGRQLSAQRYLQAVEQMHRLGRAWASFMMEYDLFLCPPLARPSVRIGELSTDGPVARSLDTAIAFAPLAMIFNATGQPSMSVPLYIGDDGLPIGSMFTARFGEEDLLFRFGGQLEQAYPWAAQRPPDLPCQSRFGEPT